MFAEYGNCGEAHRSSRGFFVTMSFFALLYSFLCSVRIFSGVSRLIANHLLLGSFKSTLAVKVVPKNQTIFTGKNRSWIREWST